MKVGCVPYINALPLIWPAVRGDADWPVEVIYDVPAALPAMLDSGEVDAVLVSSIEVLCKPGMRAVEGIGICSFGPVASVRLISSLPLPQIRSFRPDAHSMTSNALAKALLTRVAGTPPTNGDDARVLIGDLGLQSSEQAYDLGECWTDDTGFPFVWALWVGREGLTGELATCLHEGCRRGLADLENVKQEAHRRGPFDRATLDHYFDTNIHFQIGPEEMQGLNEFRTWTECLFEPEWVSPKVEIAP